jgi:glycosyltransferase involved in cell wall biosynthesis
MRVLQVYKDYYPVLGGIEHHVQILAEGLQGADVQVTVLVTNTGRETLETVINGVGVTKTGRLGTISSAPISPDLFRRLGRLSRTADIAHLHFPYPPAEIAQLSVGRSRRFVLTYHSDIVRQRLLGLVYRPIMWRVLRRADAITVSNPQYIETSPFLQPFSAKCTVIHHGIDLSRFIPTADTVQRSAAIRREHGDAALVLAVGKLRHYKGIDVLIAAMTQVAAHLIVVGKGPMGPIWQRQAADPTVAGRITFLGEVSEAELVALYHTADIFVLPSTNRAETWGTVQIEAMACGLPVICTELGTGTSYVNQDGITGIVVPARDPTALANAIRRLVEDPALRQQFGEGGRQRAHDELSKEVMVQRMITFYQRVLGDA